MNFEGIIKKIKNDTWWSEESPCNYQQSISAWRAFVHQGKIYGPKFLSIDIILYKNDFIFEKTSRSEKLAQFYKALQMFTTNPSVIQKDYKNFLKAKNDLIEKGERLIITLKKDKQQLAAAYKAFYDTYTAVFTHSVMPEAADVYSDEALKGDPETNIVLSTYPMLSFMEQERLDFLTMILSKKIDFGKFAKKYHWIQNNYLGAKNLDEKYFRRVFIELRQQKTKQEILKELESLRTKVLRLKAKQKQLQSKLKLPYETNKTFELLRFISRWIDERKWTALHAIYYLDAFLKEVSKRTKTSKDILGYTKPEEMVNLLINGQNNEKELAERRKLSVYVYCKNGSGYQELIFTGKKARTIFKLFEQKTTKIISGHVASAPVEKFKGKVQVLLNPHKEKFIAGRILVTTMTRPDFVPLMRRASAIITDEGGITSHAAIVSRELGIPCIIGTKISTKALKTGDTVEIDLIKGIVRKL